MKAKWIGIGVGVTLLLVVVITAVGWMFWQRTMWGYGMTGGSRGMMEDNRYASTCPDNSAGRGTTPMGWGGMMGSNQRFDECDVQGWDSTSSDEQLTIAEAKEAAHDYISEYAENLSIAEIMEFDHNFYAIVVDEDTHIGAMELLIDKWTGNVGPEMGPNMMWNTAYGMRGRGGMMARQSSDPLYTEQEMLEFAQQWLDDHQPGAVVADHGDMFYGYMTAHILVDNEITGMLSVNSNSAEVWYHTWHGDFIAMESFIGEDTHD